MGPHPPSVVFLRQKLNCAVGCRGFEVSGALVRLAGDVAAQSYITCIVFVIIVLPCAHMCSRVKHLVPSIYIYMCICDPKKRQFCTLLAIIQHKSLYNACF